MTMAGTPYSFLAARAFETRSAPTSRGLSVRMRTPVFTPGPTTNGDHPYCRRQSSTNVATIGGTEEADATFEFAFLAGMPHKIFQRSRVLVGRALEACGHAPRSLRLLALEHADIDVLVPDVKQEDGFHGDCSSSA